MATAPTPCEAYVIENDGSRRPLDVEFVGSRTSAAGTRPAAAQSGTGAVPRSAYAGAAAATVAAAAAAAATQRTRARTAGPDSARPRSPHIVRRLLGGALMRIGLPLLVLPGPGVLLLALGLLLLVKP